MEQRPILSVDVVLLTLKAERLSALLVRRESEPYAGRLALPGGFVHVDEDKDAASTALRVLREKAGVSPPYLEQLYTVSGATRDPRGWSAAIAYYALVPQFESSTAHATLGDVDALDERLAFDHDAVLQLAVKRVRDKTSYSALPCYLLPERFTLGELQRTYEQVLGERLNKASFRRKLAEQDFLEKAAGQRAGAHRPAQLYRMRRRARSSGLVIFDRTV